MAKDFLFAGSLTTVLLVGAVVTVLLAVAVPKQRDALVQWGATVVLRLRTRLVGCSRKQEANVK